MAFNLEQLFNPIEKQMKYTFHALSFILYLLNAQKYQVSVDFPFLVANSLTNVLNITTDLNNNFWVLLADATVRVYDPTFTTYTVIPSSEKPELLINCGISNLPFGLSNGTSFWSTSGFQLAIFNNSTAINLHNSNNYSIISSYQLNDTIMLADGNSFQYYLSKVTPYVAVICKHSMKFIYQSSIYTIYNYNTFGANLIALSASLYSYNLIKNQKSNNQWIYQYVLALNNSKVYLITVVYSFYFNYTTNSYDYTGLTSNYSVLVGLTENISSMISIWNFQIVLMQATSGNYYFYDFTTKTNGKSSTNMSNYKMMQLIQYYSKEYILTSLGLMLVQYSPNLLTLTIQTILPNNHYFIVAGYYFDLLYVVGGPSVYKANLCLNQSYYQVSSVICQPYNCSVPNCHYCPIYNTTCGICDSGYSRNDNYTCNITPPVPATNLSNVNPYSQFVITVTSIEFFQQFIQFLLDLLEKVIEIPGARAIISPIFYLFGNFDDLYLYQFHDRKYNSVMTEFFNELNNLETKKWNVVNYTEVISYFANVEAFNNLTNFQQQYQQFNYTYNTINQNQSQGLLYNSQSYFIIVLPITFAYFWIFHFLFRLLSNYAISKFIRKYYFALFLLVIQMDGNVQQLSFYLVRQFISIFAFTFSQKVLKLAIINYGFILIFAGCSIFYFYRLFYRKYVKILMQMSESKSFGIFIAIFHFGLRNIVLSSLHFFGRFLSENILIKLLLLSEVLFSAFILLLFCKKVYKQKLKIVLKELISTTRIALIITFILDFEANSEIIQNFQLILIISMIAIFSIGIIIDVLQTIAFYFTFFIQKIIYSNKITPNSGKNSQQKTNNQSAIKSIRLGSKLTLVIFKTKNRALLNTKNREQDVTNIDFERSFKIKRKNTTTKTLSKDFESCTSNQKKIIRIC